MTGKSCSTSVDNSPAERPSEQRHAEDAKQKSTTNAEMEESMKKQSAYPQDDLLERKTWEGDANPSPKESRRLAEKARFRQQSESSGSTDK